MADEVKLSSLRVSAQLDASAYQAGANQKVAADKAMVASGQQVSATVTQTDIKISQAGDVLARLSRQYVDGYAAAQRMNSALNQLNSQIERGNIQIGQAGPILDGIARKYGEIGAAEMFAARGQREFADAITAANQRLAAQQAISARTLAAANQNQGGLQRFGAINAAAQLQDIAITAAMGQSITTIALQQGTQLGQAMENLVVKGTGAMGLVRGLGAAFMTMLTPVNLIAIGLTAATAAAFQFGSAILNRGRDIEDVLKAHKNLIDEIAAAYPQAAAAAKAYEDQAAKLSRSVITADIAQQRKEEAAFLASSIADIAFQMQSIGTQAGGVVTPGAAAFRQLGQDLGTGAITARELSDQLGKVRLDPNVSPNVRNLAERLQESVNQAADLEAKLKGVGAAAESLSKFRQLHPELVMPDTTLQGQFTGANARAAAVAEANQKIIRQELETERSAARERAEIAQINARTMEERVAAARQLAEAEHPQGEEAWQRALRIGTEVTLERARAERELADAARDRALSQQESLEGARLELQVVGQNRLARQAAIETLRTEQEIRRLGPDLSKAEADAMRETTAALNDYAETTARASLQQDLLFEARQAGRSDSDRRIAARLRGAGQPEDLQGPQADMMRHIEQMERIRETWEGLFDTVNDGVDTMVDALFEGTDDWGETLKKIGRDFARQMFDLALTNPLKNWLTGGNLNTVADLVAPGTPGFSSGRGGGFGGALGNLLGAQKTVASMQVQAATVIVNGGIMPGASGIPGVPGVPGSGGAGSGGISQATIQNRIDQAFGTTSQATIQNRIDQAFGTGGGAASLAGGGDVQSQVWNFFAKKGLPSHQIAGIMGHVGAESGFNPRAVGDAGQALGLFQWNDRSASMLRSIGGRGQLGNVQKQLEFAWGEMQGPESKAFQALRASTDVRGATRAFGGYERAQGFSWADPENIHNWRGRFGGAQEALSKYGGGGGVTQASEALDSLTTSSVKAADSLQQTSLAGMSTVKGLTDAAGGLTQFGSLLSSFMGAGGGAGTGWFKNLIGLAGSAAGAIGGMQAISPMATSAILAGGALGPAGLYHEGGLAGFPAGYRNVNSRAFIGARRYHNGGLAGDEVPAILRKGEPVFRSMADARRMFQPANRNDAARVNVNLKNINLFDPSVVGDYVRTDPGEQAMINMMRRTGSGRGL